MKLRRPDINGDSMLNVAIVFLSFIVLANMILFYTLPRMDIGPGSQWLYDVQIGGSMREQYLGYEEKMSLDTIVYCERILCYKISVINPLHLYIHYVTGDYMLVRTEINDLSDGSYYDIRYSPPLMLRPKNIYTGVSWVWNSVAKITVVRDGMLEVSEVRISNVENQVVEKVILQGPSGDVEAYIIEERTDGFLTKHSIYSPAVREMVRYESRSNMIWGELIGFSLRPQSPLDFLSITILQNFKLWHILLFLGLLLGLKATLITTRWAHFF